MSNSNVNVNAGWMIDGTGRRTSGNVLITICDGWIKSVSCPCEQSETENIIDLTDYTILPGLMDSHVHLAWSASGDPEIRRHQFDTDFMNARKTIARNLASHLSCGVLTVRDGGDKRAHTLEYKKRFSKTDYRDVCIKSSGRACYKSGRYGRIIGVPLDESFKYPEDVNRLKENGIDQIKIVQSGLNSLKRFGAQTPPQFSLEELKHVVAEAEMSGLKVMVHANGELPVKLALQAGCHSIEHGFFMGRDNIERMAEEGCFWVPTAVTMKSYAGSLKSGTVESDVAEKNLHHQLEQIRIARNAGVKLAVGTDAGTLGVDHGKAVADEMQLLIQAGYAVEEAVQCTTSNPAELLGEESRGLLAPGKRADFIAVKAHPDYLIDGLKGQVKVFIGGEEILT